jgi:hypothetical protein
VTAAVNASDAAIETVLRHRFFLQPEHRRPLRLRPVNMAAGGETLLAVGLADAATKPLHGDRRVKLFPSGIILIRPSSRPL